MAQLRAHAEKAADETSTWLARFHSKRMPIPQLIQVIDRATEQAEALPFESPGLAEHIAAEAVANWYKEHSLVDVDVPVAVAA